MFLQARHCCVSQAGLELTPPQYWDLRYELLDLILLIIFENIDIFMSTTINKQNQKT